MINYKIHPLAETFPQFTSSEFEALVEDISRNGQREPITLFEGKVLDGVHRLKACRQLNMEPRVRNYSGKDPLGFSVSENLKRRHLNESQRAVIAAKLTGVESNSSKPNSAFMQTSRPNTKEAAAQLNVSPRAVETAKVIIREAPKKVINQIVAGTKKLAAATKDLKKQKAANVDATGYPIPDEILSDWREAESFDELIKQLHRVKLRVEKQSNKTNYLSGN